MAMANSTFPQSCSPCCSWPFSFIVLHLSWPVYQAIRQALGTRRNFFNDLRALTRYLYFPSWDELLAFMYRQLELPPL
ncbi:MAG: hypothetical protein ACUVWZ_16415 [Anaerolineae bacterium]